MKNANVQTTELVSDGQFQEINRAALIGVTPFITRLRQTGSVKQFTGGTLVADTISAALLTLLPERIKIPGTEVERWQKYYRDQFGINAELGELEIPAPPSHPARFRAMHAEVSNRCNRIMEVCRKHYAKYWQFNDDLDSAISRHDRSGTYSFWVADSREAEFGNVDGINLSSQQVWDRGLITTTLPERLIDGDVYFLERKEHLDQEKITLCAGSRAVRGRVSGVCLNPSDGNVHVNCWYPTNADSALRFRLATV